MAPSAHPALLPAGFADLLPPRAAQEDALIQAMMQLTQSHGYDRVSPPLLEYEDNLLSGPGVSLAAHTFRLMDPLSGQMLGLRADMTVQVARIATTRLAAAPRPLRLAYAGQVVRQGNNEHRPERQSGQVGLELIGSASPAADAEIILLACRCLQAVGITEYTLDISLPTLVSGLCQAQGLDAAQTGQLRQLLDRKDHAAVTALNLPLTPLLLALLRLSGALPAALHGLSQLTLPEPVQAEVAHLSAVWQLLKGQADIGSIMLDLVEFRGFEYHTGLGYTLFANGRGGELGRGGRYHSKARGSVEPGEPATGFTFYSENLLAAMPEPSPPRKLYLPQDVPETLAATLRAQGYVTIRALTAETDVQAAARGQGCSHLLQDGQLVKIG